MQVQSSPATAVAQEIAAECVRLGVSMDALARRSGTARSTLARKLAGRSPLTVTDLLAVADVTGTSAAEFIRRAQRATASQPTERTTPTSAR